MTAWPFPDPENVATFTVRQITHGGQPILLVSHDADDGMWQFLTGDSVEMADTMLVSLRSVEGVANGGRGALAAPTGGMNRSGLELPTTGAV